MAADDDQRRPVLDGTGLEQGLLQGVEVLGRLTQLDHVPAVGVEAGRGVVRERQLGRAVDRDVVVVVDVHQAAQAQVPGQRSGLVADALGQVAVGDHRPDVVVADVDAEALPQRRLGDRHADAVGEALAERPGGDLDARGVADLGVPRRARPPLAERLEVLDRHVVAGQVQHRVLKDRGVTAAEDEPVAVGPLRRRRVVAHDPGPQHVRQRGERHGRSLVAAPGRGGGVHRQATDDVDRPLLERGVHRGGELRHGESCPVGVGPNRSDRPGRV